MTLLQCFKAGAAEQSASVSIIVNRYSYAYRRRGVRDRHIYRADVQSLLRLRRAARYERRVAVSQQACVRNQTAAPSKALFPGESEMKIQIRSGLSALTLAA